MSRRIQVAAIAVLLGALLAVYWSTKPRNAEPVLSTERRPDPPPARVAAALQDTPSELNVSADSVLGVSRRKTHDIQIELRVLCGRLAEERGLRAQLLEFNGTTCRLFVPGMVLSEEELELRVREALEGVVSDQEITRIWRNPESRGYLERQLQLGKLGADTWFSITKVQEEVPGLMGEVGEASFHAQIRRVRSNGAPGYEGTELETWVGRKLNSLLESGNLGWNAAAKVPAKFLRSEPILGVASRPRFGVSATIDYDTGTVEIRNLRSDGSKETVNLNEFAERK